MELTVCNRDKRLYIKLLGEIDHHEVTRARQELDDTIMKKRPELLVMDLSGVDFMDSSGLGFILGRMRKMNDCGGGLVVLNPTKRVEQMLKMAGAEKILKITYSKDFLQ